jgi:hypothetical protein
MGFAEFIIGPARGRTRWLYPSYAPVVYRESCWLKYFGNYIELTPKNSKLISSPYSNGVIVKKRSLSRPTQFPLQSRGGLTGQH